MTTILGARGGGGHLEPDDGPDVTLTVDGVEATVPTGASLLAACESVGAPQPTLCTMSTLTPVNACRLCVVEVEGAGPLVPSCSRAAEDGMVVETRSPRVVHARRLVLELLASSVDLSLADDVAGWMAELDADPGRFGPADPHPIDRDGARPGDHLRPVAGYAASRAQPVKVDNPLYVRDYGRCILCYRCVEACGEDAQNTFAIAVAGRGFDARISTEFAAPLPDSACVYCGNCIDVCPTDALMFRSEHALRSAGLWDADAQTVTRTVCSFCGVGCNVDLHVQGERIVKVSSPTDHEVSVGHLCVKGRFGYDYVQERDDEHTPIDEVLAASRSVPTD